jgi:hypothetical protein
MKRPQLRRPCFSTAIAAHLPSRRRGGGTVPVVLLVSSARLKIGRSTANRSPDSTNKKCASEIVPRRKLCRRRYLRQSGSRRWRCCWHRSWGVILSLADAAAVSRWVSGQQLCRCEPGGAGQQLGMQRHSRHFAWRHSWHFAARFGSHGAYAYILPQFTPRVRAIFLHDGDIARPAFCMHWTTRNAAGASARSRRWTVASGAGPRSSPAGNTSQQQGCPHP